MATLPHNGCMGRTYQAAASTMDLTRCSLMPLVPDFVDSTMLRKLTDVTPDRRLAELHTARRLVCGPSASDGKSFAYNPGPPLFAAGSRTVKRAPRP
jgi:hypothetical protein